MTKPNKSEKTSYEIYKEFLEKNPVQDDAYGHWKYDTCTGKYDELRHTIDSLDEVWPEPSIIRKYIPNEKLGQRVVKRLPPGSFGWVEDGWTTPSSVEVSIAYPPEMGKHIKKMRELEITNIRCRCENCVIIGPKLIRKLKKGETNG